MKRKYGLRVEYRMTCEKSNPKNICCDRSRDKGFFWLSLNNNLLQKQFNTLKITDNMELDAISEKLESITIPDGCVAVRCELFIYLNGTECNGTYRKNVSFEYFKDFYSDL